MRWQLLSQDIPQTVSETMALMLANRGITDAERFFNPPHPENLTLAELGFDESAMQKAVKLILQACSSNQKVVIFGDYDADGISATAVLWQSLKSVGCIAKPFIPQRDKHGYGLSVGALQEIITADKPDVLITVDNGIVAHKAAAFAKEQGLQLIISDHHQPEVDESGRQYFPPADAIVHTTKLCGTTVAWILGRELVRANDAAQQTKTVARQDGLDLCGLATISDQVPLLGANRSFAFHGISALQKTQRVGLRALYTLAGIDAQTIDNYTVGFVLSPRVNAMGRLAHGLDALRLFCTTSPERAVELAGVLSSMNVERQDMTQEQLDLAIEQVQVQINESILIAHSPEFHEGVIGLIAGRLVEKFSKPAIVLSVGEKSIKGSARSVAGVNITELMRQVREDLLEVGGHPMAGGLSVAHEKLEVVKSRLFTLAKEQIDATLLVPSLIAECELPLQLLTAELVTELQQCAPFGSGNHKPNFVLNDLRIISCQVLGKEGRHLKIVLEPTDFSSPPIEALYWQNGHRCDDFPVGTKLHCMAQLESNTWKGRTKLQLIVKDCQLLDS